MDGAVYGLLALLIGFTFSGAAERFNNRRVLIGDIDNTASTVWRRIDLLPPEQQPAIRAGLRRYVDELIAYYTNTATVRQSLQTPAALASAEDDLGLGPSRRAKRPEATQRACCFSRP